MPVEHPVTITLSDDVMLSGTLDVTQCVMFMLKNVKICFECTFFIFDCGVILLLLFIFVVNRPNTYSLHLNTICSNHVSMITSRGISQSACTFYVLHIFFIISNSDLISSVTLSTATAHKLKTTSLFSERTVSKCEEASLSHLDT